MAECWLQEIKLKHPAVNEFLTFEGIEASTIHTRCVWRLSPFISHSGRLGCWKSQMSLQEEHRSARPTEVGTTETIESVRYLADEDRRIKGHEIAHSWDIQRINLHNPTWQTSHVKTLRKTGPTAIHGRTPAESPGGISGHAPQISQGPGTSLWPSNTGRWIFHYDPASKQVRIASSPQSAWSTVCRQDSGLNFQGRGRATTGGLKLVQS